MNELDWQILEEYEPVEKVFVSGIELKKGDKVILRPKKNADAFDMALKDQVAIIESIEQDYEDRIQFAVVLEDDPGRDLGMLRQPGHRFFFSIEEVEPCVFEKRN